MPTSDKKYQTNRVSVIESNRSIFDCDVQAIVNPVNLVGVMGKGLALQFKRRYPDAFETYRDQCQQGHFQFGQVFLYNCFTNSNPRYIIHFPTKFHWEDDSDYNLIEEGLTAMRHCVYQKAITSIAVPPLGCGCGGLNRLIVKRMVMDSLCSSDCPHLDTLYLLQF